MEEQGSDWESNYSYIILLFEQPRFKMLAKQMNFLEIFIVQDVRIGLTIDLAKTGNK